MDIAADDLCLGYWYLLMDKTSQLRLKAGVDVSKSIDHNGGRYPGLIVVGLAWLPATSKG